MSAPLLVVFPILIQLGFVFIGGQAMPMRSRQTELRDRYLERLRRGAAR